MRVFRPQIGYTETRVPVKKLMSFADYIRWCDGDSIPIITDIESVRPSCGNTGDRSSFIHVDAAGEVIRYIVHTNPNDKWDWWVIGGRWSGLLCAKSGTKCKLGRPNIFGKRYNDVGCDQIRRWDLDIPATVDVWNRDGITEPFRTNAILTEKGTWYEKGVNGWWSVDTLGDLASEDTWDANYVKFLTDISSELWLTVIDYHI